VDLNIGLTVSTQCCYGADLKLLVLGHKGAGSVDFSSKLSAHDSNDADHFLNDLYPSLACCALSDNCVKYSAVRPAMLLPETPAEVQQSCEVMQHVYEWHPYKTFPPPYARPQEIEDWKNLKLTKTSLVPTTLLAKVLKDAQDARKRIHAGQEPYPEPTTHAAATHTTEEETTRHTTEEETTRHTTEEETTHRPAATTHKTEEEPTTHKAAATTHTTTHEPERRTADDRAMDRAIEAVLKAQTKHEGKGKTPDAKEKAKEKAADAKERKEEAKEDEAIEREEEAASRKGKGKGNEGKSDKASKAKSRKH